MQLLGCFFCFFYEKGHFSVIQYVKDHVHTQKSADSAIAHLRTRTFALSPKSNKQQ